MYKFGKTPPRLLESFGVSGLLAENCWVFYNPLYTTQHLGRISDLLAARLKEAGGDELRLRAILLHTIFEAYHAQTGDHGLTKLTEPVVVECGVDDEKLAVGVSFTLPRGAQVQIQGLLERVVKGTPQGYFEARLADLVRHSNRVVLRVQASIRRIEIVSVIGIPGKMDAAELASPSTLDLVVISQNPSETPKALTYVELGDLDYPKLLRETEEEPLAPARSGEIRQIVEGKELGEALANKVIRGATQHIRTDHVTRVSGGSAKVADETVIRISGGGGETGAESGPDGLSASQVRLYLDRIEELQKKIAALEEDRARAEFRVRSPAPVPQADELADQTVEEEGEDTAQPRGGLIKRIWPFNKKDAVEETDESEEEESDEEEEDTAASASAVAPPVSDGEVGAPGAEDPVTDPASASQAAQGSNAEAVAKSLAAEIQGGSLDRTINRAQKEAGELKKEMGSARAKRWVDGLMTELSSEKNRLQDLAKKTQMTVRQKELEFRNKEHAFQQELARRDELLKQKNTALMRSKEQLMQVNMNLERMKSASSAGQSEDPHLKTRHAQTQKLLLASKEENSQLTDKIEELRAALSKAQVAAVKSGGPGYAEHQAVQQKLERSIRLIEEYKRQNQQLMDRLNDPKKTGSPINTNFDELKKRFDAAMKLVTISKKESDRLTLRVEEIQREEMLLKRELQMAQAELKVLKGVKGGGGSGTGTPPPAAA